MESNFYIVEFSNSIQLVPKIWLTNDDKKCFLPKHYTALRYEKSVRNQEKPDASWTDYDVLRILGKSCSFDTGKRKLQRTAVTPSVNNSTASNSTVQEYPVKKTCFCCSEKEMISSQTVTSAPLHKSPAALIDLTLDAGESIKTITPSQPVIELLNSPASNYGSANLSHKVANLEFQFDELKKNQLLILEKLEILTSSLIQDSRTSLMQKSKANSMQKSEDNSVQESEDSLMQGSEENSKQENETNSEIDIEFPIKTLEALLELDKKLEDGRFKSSLVHKLKKIGGRGVKSYVVRQLQFLLTSELALQFTYYGTKSKHSFSALKLKDVVTEVTKKHVRAPEDVIKEFIAEWFRRAKDRIIYAQDRLLKKCK